MVQRAGVSFELEGLDLEGDQLVVTGHWSGVRGLRFVRPMLVADDRRILATLEHKPWAPSLDRAWVAAFPWEGDEVNVDALTLAVAPQVTVALSGAPLDEPQPVPGPPPAPEPAPVAPIGPPEPPPAEPEPEPELPPAAAAPAPVAPTRLPEPAPAAPARAPRARRVAAHESELQSLARERDAAQRERDEAVAARDAAVRAHAGMQVAHDEALQARAGAEAALAAVRAERDVAHAQRDDILLAYRDLQRQVQDDRARADRAHEDRAHDRAPEDPTGLHPPVGSGTAPAAREPTAKLPRVAPPAGGLPFSERDVWVIRVLGTVAACCSVVLLVSLLRVFI